jgi:hypothetical protein
MGASDGAGTTKIKRTMNSKRPSTQAIAPANRRARLVRRCLAVCLFFIAAVAQAQSWTPSEQLLNMVRKIESADGLMVVGDHGNSRGAYQMSAAAWLDVSAWRRARKLEVSDYEVSVWNETVSRSYAANYLQILHERLAKALKRTPSSGEVYAAYNMGFTAFARCGFSLARVNAVTASNCRRIAAVTNDEEALELQPTLALTVVASK